MPPMKSGIPLALASAVLFGASTPFAKLLLGTVDPWLMAGLLYIGAGLGLAIVHLLRGILRLPAIEAPLRRPDLPWLAGRVLRHPAGHCRRAAGLAPFGGKRIGTPGKAPMRLAELQQHGADGGRRRVRVTLRSARRKIR